MLPAIAVSNMHTRSVVDQEMGTSTATAPCVLAYSLPLHEIDIQISGKVVEAEVIDPGSQIIIIQENLARKVGATINTSHLLQIEGANGATN